ncbi:GNAT family N-acetyltransferase [Emticicia sp. C21]|uniref:GNAT family N-acetyltransferase n=1 Tax=Emticicia sp. C21 TaxID=2302915 RepID=UPI000E3421FF|nr:GNAT family N-acetyltransferase [Emticicia sp. C21]RFS15119.1 GNAT family N-acetyltransferase [Emticicia sp. C21]
MEYQIRAIQAQDLPALVELCHKHAEYEHADYNPIGKEEQLSKVLFAETPKLFCWVVESNQQLVGYASYTFDYSTWDVGTFLYLDCLYLEPGCRGLGIGEEIMQKLKVIAQQNNCVNIQWQTPDFNTRAIRFYERMGGVGKNKVRFTWDL